MLPYHPNPLPSCRPAEDRGEKIVTPSLSHGKETGRARVIAPRMISAVIDITVKITVKLIVTALK
eukprot:113463-Hanusia_phi.AAC.1